MGMFTHLLLNSKMEGWGAEGKFLKRRAALTAERRGGAARIEIKEQTRRHRSLHL